MKTSRLFAPFGWLYGAIINVRTALYEQGIFESVDLGVSTISIGNITLGGTGKTPLVAFTAQVLAENGEKVCVLTRGYKRENERERILVSDGEKIFVSARQAGDEPFELAQKLLGRAAVIADANRAAAGTWARENLGITAFVLDDAFQHLKVKRDLNIVCIDATNPFGNKRLLPAGILREPLRNLQRADAVVITRANLVDGKQIDDLKAAISGFNQKTKNFVSQNKIKSMTDLSWFSEKSKKNRENQSFDTYYAFCALGNPEGFFKQLQCEKFNVISFNAFPDHYVYTQKDINELENAARKAGAEILLTTAKDAVKLLDLKFNLPCVIAESEMIFDNEGDLRKMILNAVA